MEVNANIIYTREECQKILKVSQSTILRLIKKGSIRAARVGKQYRILGKDLLVLVSNGQGNGGA